MKAMISFLATPVGSATFTNTTAGPLAVIPHDQTLTKLYYQFILKHMPQNDKIDINGHLDIFVNQNEDIDSRGHKESWNEVLIHGDSEGLESLAIILLKIAREDQNQINDKVLPHGARVHVHLRPNIELSRSSDQTIIGRLDAKGTGVFYERYVPKKKK